MRGREARNTLQPQILPHFCITRCDIYSTETNPPPTPEFSHNSALFLTHAVSSRGWQKSSSLLLGTRLSEDRERESMRISCLPFCTWGRKWHLSLPLTGFHMAPSMCRGAWSELYSVPARRGVARAASFIDFLLLLQVGSHLRVFPSMTFYCERGIWALEWDRLVGQVSPVELLRIPVVKLFNTNNPLFTIYQKSIVVDRN